MKKTVLFFMTIFLAATFHGSANVTAALSQEQTGGKSVSQADTTIAAHEEPITKTVVLDDEEVEETTDTPPRNKWITAGLVLFGIVGFFILKSKRKKKPVNKEFDHK